MNHCVDGSNQTWEAFEMGEVSMLISWNLTTQSVCQHSTYPPNLIYRRYYIFRTRLLYFNKIFIGFLLRIHLKEQDKATKNKIVINTTYIYYKIINLCTHFTISVFSINL